MALYQTIPTLPFPTPPGIVRATDGAIIPAAPGNSDWEDYQAWLAAGNTPDPAPGTPA